MNTTDLDQAKAHLKEYGCVSIPAVITREKAAHALSALWAAKEGAESRGEPAHIPFLDPNPNNVRVFNLVEADEIFRELVAHPTAIELVKAVFGETFLISNLSANIARPGSRSMALHSDQSLNLPEPWAGTTVMNVCWCLTDVTRENGATMYIPGSNKWTSHRDIPENAPDLLVPLEGKAGDIIIMDGRVWHTSGCNTTEDQDRALVFAFYTAPYMRTVVNWTAKLPRELQDTLSQEMKDWMGLAPFGNIPVVGDLRYISQQYPPRVSN
ncbi:phytanoyl-CoA dioxygenase family protein [Xylaria intraflava]|nr:phytanoyl-CoA dioxygenase family protein [Xylaria intraflava]